MCPAHVWGPHCGIIPRGLHSLAFPTRVSPASDELAKKFASLKREKPSTPPSSYSDKTGEGIRLGRGKCPFREASTNTRATPYWNPRNRRCLHTPAGALAQYQFLEYPDQLIPAPSKFQTIHSWLTGQGSSSRAVSKLGEEYPPIKLFLNACMLPPLKY